MQLPWTKTRNQTDVPDQRDYWSSHRHTAHNSSAAPPTSHTPAFPPTQPSVQYQYPYYPPQQHYEQLQSHDRPQPVAGPFGSRGRDYLQSLSTDLSNLDLERIGPSGTGHHTRSHSSPKPSLEKPLPSTPRYPSAPPPHDPLRGNTTSPLVYSTPPLPRPPRLVWETDEHGAALGTQETGPPCVSQTIHDVHKQQSSPSSSALQKQDSTTSGAYPVTPPRAFKPSRYLASPSVLLAPHSEPRLSRPKSDLVVPTRKTHTTVKKANKSKSSGALRKPIIIIDSESDKSDSDSYVPSIIDIPDTVTNRSPARRKRATSEIPCGPGKTSSSPKPPRVTANTPNTVSGKCAGFTRKGQPCQRLVRDAAPLLMLLDTNTPQEERITARYCKDHAGMICNVKGFYWRLSAESEGIWVDFAHFIPDDLGQQTQALLRMAMESPLTDKEASGYLYAYELRDLNTHETSFFKVGRTDNVPRRIGEWTTRCRRHTPTLRDIFPSSMSPSRRVHESGVSLNRNPSAPTSFLPGALRHSTNPHRTCPAVKRWERLVHLELADRSSSTASEEYLSLKQRCEECDAVHREIFPLGKQDRVYEDTIREVICRWERFIRQICQDA